MERMFDDHSFQDEVQSNADAKSCVMHLAHNESKFRRELASEGLTYEQVEEEVKKVWKNLLKACSKYGYVDFMTQFKREQFGVK